MSWLYSRAALGFALLALIGSGMFLSSIKLSAQAEGLPSGTSSSILGLPGYILNSQINQNQQMARKTNYSQNNNFYSNLEPPDEQGLVTFTDRYRHPITQEEFMQNIQPPPLQDASF